MAAPRQSPEQAFRLRKFQGTNTEIDSTFLGPSVVSRSENWIPTQSYRLGKRPGTTLMQQVSFSTTEVSDLLCARDGGVLYLYAFCLQSGGTAFIAQSIEEQPFTYNDATSPGVSFPTNARGRMIQFRDRIYAGNGVYPLVTWKMGDPPANTLVFNAIANLGPPAAGTLGDASAGNQSDRQVPTGTYAYAWGAFDTVKKVYTGRTDAGSLVVPAGKVASFTSPSVALPANNIYRLFVAPRGFPVEYASMQADNLAASTATNTFSSFDVTDQRVPMAGGVNVFRTGNMFVIWRNRVVFAGSANDPYSVFATDVILPGTEQASFNQGTMFPANAKVPLPARVTGIGIAGTTTDQDASSPLLFFTSSKTFVCMGDPFSIVDQATLIEVSSRVGCVAHDSIVNTPSGTIFVGIDSVYLIPPGGGYPEDIGWPIANEIRAIPPSSRQLACAMFHKQFYKLAIPAPGGGPPIAQWWLDLRQGVGNPPSWWGPHSGVTVSAMAADPSSTLEVDRGYAAIAASDDVVRVHQPGIFSDHMPGAAHATGITSVLKSGRFDADEPFLAKIFTRLRLIAQTAVRSDIHVTFETDGGDTWAVQPIELGRNAEMPGQFVHLTPIAVPPGPANFQSWNHDPPPEGDSVGTIRGNAKFRTIAPVEVQTITPAIRPRGLSAVITLTHAPMHDPMHPEMMGAVAQVELRDFELLFIPSERKVRYLHESVGK